MARVRARVFRLGGGGGSDDDELQRGRRRAQWLLVVPPDEEDLQAGAPTQLSELHAGGYSTTPDGSLQWTPAATEDGESALDQLPPAARVAVIRATEHHALFPDTRLDVFPGTLGGDEGDAEEEGAGGGEAGGGDAEEEGAGGGEAGASDAEEEGAGGGEAGASDAEEEGAGGGEAGASDAEEEGAGGGEAGGGGRPGFLIDLTAKDARAGGGADGAGGSGRAGQAPAGAHRLKDFMFTEGVQGARRSGEDPPQCSPKVVGEQGVRCYLHGEILDGASAGAEVKNKVVRAIGLDLSASRPKLFACLQLKRSTLWVELAQPSPAYEPYFWPFVKEIMIGVAAASHCIAHPRAPPAETAERVSEVVLEPNNRGRLRNASEVFSHMDDIQCLLQVSRVMAGMGASRTSNQAAKAFINKAMEVMTKAQGKEKERRAKRARDAGAGANAQAQQPPRQARGDDDEDQPKRRRKRDGGMFNKKEKENADPVPGNVIPASDREKIDMNFELVAPEGITPVKRSGAAQAAATARRAVAADGSASDDADGPDAGDTNDTNDTNDGVCVFCDDGGDLLMCDGPCKRSFHKYANPASKCKGIRLSEAERLRIKGTNDRWVCESCREEAHECYWCHETGDAREGAPRDHRVVKCQHAGCGRFYHMRCLIEAGVKPADVMLLADGGEGERPSDEAKMEAIRRGDPAAVSFFCPLHRCAACGEGASADRPLLRCRRCPVAYHEGCLPEGIREREAAGERRHWPEQDNIMYCLRHDILPECSTPARLTQERMRQGIAVVKRRRGERVRSTGAGGGGSGAGEGAGERAGEGAGGGDDPPRAEEDGKVAPPLVPAADDDGALAAARAAVEEVCEAVREAGLPSLSQVEAGIVQVFPYHASALDFRMPSREYVRNVVSQAELAMRALRQGNERAARETCRREDLRTIDVLMSRLPAFTAPYRDRATYSSFGRNFTKSDHLREIVRKLRPLLRDDDMLIDHSCGSNEWLAIARDELQGDGLRGLAFRGFDIFLARNDRDFEQYDFMRLTRASHRWLPPGDRLVVGLNPPFGFDVSGGGRNLAYKFMAHAARELQPRVLAIICPADTDHPQDYRLVDQDRTLCAGAAFFFPGSKDRTKQNQSELDKCLLDQQTNKLTVVRLYVRVTAADRATFAGGGGHEDEVGDVVRHAIEAAPALPCRALPRRGGGRAAAGSRRRGEQDSSSYARGRR